MNTSRAMPYLALALNFLLAGVLFRSPVSAQEVFTTLGADPDAGMTPLEGAAELTEELAVEQILARNPTIAEMEAAWAAASARYPQAKALEDPMIGGGVGPSSIGSPDVDFAYRLEASQKIPFPGKRKLRGASALLEAAASGQEVEAVRLELAEKGRDAFQELYLAERALELNQENLAILGDLRSTADAAYRTGTVSQQDILQADVEIGRQRERLLTLDRTRRVAQGRLNTLMHLPPSAKLPPTTKEVAGARPLPAVAELQQLALGARPEIHAERDRIAANEIQVRLAYKDYKPDFELMAAYDAFWQAPEDDLRTMVGVRANLPVYTAKRRAAVAEAQAMLSKRHAALRRLVDETNLEVWDSYHQVVESEQAVRLYQETILEAAAANVQVARADYQTGKIPFITLLAAQRSLLELREAFYTSQAAYRRRLASLRRAVGVDW